MVSKILAVSIGHVFIVVNELFSVNKTGFREILTPIINHSKNTHM